MLMSIAVLLCYLSSIERKAWNFGPFFRYCLSSIEKLWWSLTLKLVPSAAQRKFHLFDNSVLGRFRHKCSRSCGCVSMVRNQNIPSMQTPYESKHARTDESGNIYDSGLKHFLKCKPRLGVANGACWELLEFWTWTMVRIGQLGVSVC